MKRFSRLLMLTTLSLTTALGAAAAPLDYDEALLGDLSSDTNAPTPVVFDVGANVVTGTTGQPLTGLYDNDVITFTLAPGQTLTRIDLLAYQPVGVNGTGSFMAIGAGAQIDKFNAAAHLGDALVSALGDVLPLLAAGTIYGAPGFTTPLGPGTYTWWFSEASTTIAYSVSFEVVPEPSTGLLVAAGLATLAARGRARQGLRA